MSTIIITLAGEDITSKVVIESARFESQVNGVAGTATFRVRDDAGAYTATPGAPVVLTIDGAVAWRGFLQQWVRTYVFPALNVTDFGLSRFFDATCADVNLLLVKRIVFDQGDPANVTAPLLPAHTADTTALDDLFADWLDLTGDGIDTTSLVENVGDTTWTQSGRAWEGSDTWGQAVQSIASLPAAIYYIDPDRNFVYTDVDTPDAPFGLSDQPDGVTTKGYSEMEVLKDGTGLANDVLAWGAGYGSNQPVFVRDEDATSQSVHGLWQLASLNFGVYKQTTIDRIAESIIDGSPQSKRGAKDDRVAVTCTTFEPGLRVAQKVDFTSAIFGFNDVIPIRKMEIEFDGPFTPRYMLTLSHEIDTPFSIIDNWMFHIPGFQTHCPAPMVMGPNGVCILPPTPPGPPVCTPVVCGITDGYGRTVADGLGIAECGIAYRNIDAGAWSVVPGTATVVDPGGNSPFAVLPFFGIATPSDVYWKAQVTASGTPSTGDFIGFGADTVPDFAEVDFSTDGSLVLYTNGPGENSTTMPFGPDQEFKVRLNAGGANARVKVWLATDPEPSGWTLEQPFDIPATVWDLDLYYGVVADDSNVTAEFTYLNAPGLNRCVTPQIDDFKREVFDGTWGTASDGQDWTNLAGPNAFVVFDVDETNGRVTFDTNSGSDLNAIQTLTVAPTPDIPSGPIDIYMDFYADVVPIEVNSLTSSFFLALLSDIFTNITVNLTYEQSGDITIGVVYQNSNGDGGGSSTEVVSSSLQGNWLRVRMQLTAGAVKAKAWPLGFSEPPGWNVVSDSDFTAQMLADFVGGGIDFQVGYSMFADLQLSGATYVVRVSNIDLKYPDSPCYPIGLTCFSDTLDGFDRTVAVGWGVTDSPQFPLPWVVSDPSYDSVTGNEGVMSVPNGTALTTARVSSSYLWASSFNIQTRFSFATMPNFGFGFSPLVEYGFGVHSTNFGGEASLGKVQITPTDGPLPNPFSWSRIVGLGGSTAIPHTFWDSTHLYVFEVSVVGSTIISSVWDLASPGTVYSTPGGTLPGGRQSYLSLNVANFGTASDNDIVTYYLELATCYSPFPTSSPPLNGYVCENLVSTGGTTIALQSSFLPTSTSVWVAGLLYAQPTYTEDGAAGTIELGFSPMADDPIRVCYWSVA